MLGMTECHENANNDGSHHPSPQPLEWSYKYIHSLWHLCIARWISFLLPASSSCYDCSWEQPKQIVVQTFSLSLFLHLRSTKVPSPCVVPCSGPDFIPLFQLAGGMTAVSVQSAWCNRVDRQVYRNMNIGVVYVEHLLLHNSGQLTYAK